jgi:hypothetical protein
LRIVIVKFFSLFYLRVDDLEVTITPVSPDVKSAAIVCAFHGVHDMYIVRRIFHANQLILQRVVNDVWNDILYLPCTINTLRVTISSTGVLMVTGAGIVFVNAFQLDNYPVEGRLPMGLMGLGGEIHFSKVKVGAKSIK